MGRNSTTDTKTIVPRSACGSLAVARRALVYALALLGVGGALLVTWDASFAGQGGKSSAVPVPAPACDPNWQIVPSPNQGATYNELRSLAVASPTDVWAVGYSSDVSTFRTLIERWDGTQWSIVPSPNQGTDTNELRSVAAVSSTDVWAVGDFWSESPVAQPLVEHWDGVQWSIVPSPSQGNVSELYSVAVVSSTDVWAVGYYGSGFISQTLVEHWDGTGWSLVFSLSPGSISNFLQSVTAVSESDVWAVGYWGTGSQIGTLIERWNGTQWNVVSSPNEGGYSVLSSVAAVSPTDVWAVGDYYIDPYNVSHRTLVERWDGTQWSIVPSPNQPDVQNNWLYSVAVASPTDVWAVGSYYISPATPIDQTLIERWNGTDWSVVPSPNQGTDSNDLLSVAVASPGDVWAAGYHYYGLGDQTLVERYNPCPPSPTPTVTGTPPTGTPTSTPEPPTQTVTPAPPTLTASPATETATPPSGTPVPPTPCTISFIDVPVGSTFYSYIRCLACQGIVGGYGDNTFRPNNNVTRGQAAKIISNAAGYQDPIPPDRQTFNDVPPTDTFWLYVERVALHGAISGYQCGGQGEPCPGTYYRPANNLTRGQLAKIDANVAQYNEEIPPDRQSFRDVPSTNTFWLYIERVYLHGVIGGYQCGGQGEPCPGAYFRPFNNVTRGQTAKIVANTFFPNCNPPGR